MRFFFLGKLKNRVNQLTKRIGVVLLVLGILSFSVSQVVLAALTPRSSDAYQSRIRQELSVFTDWLTVNNVNGYIGEFGWPNNTYGDSDSWNLLAETWMKDADEANLWTTAWSTGSFWTQSYKQLIYKKGSGSLIDTASSQAATLEAHPPTSNYKRGINVSGGEFGVVTDGSFSNLNPGTYSQDYIYDPSSTFTYLASRGYNLVRLPIRWERIQPNLNTALSTTESARLQSFVARASSAGLGVVLDIHNFGGYYLYDNTQSKGVQRKIGSLQLPQSSFVDLWSRLSTLFKNDANVLAYDLMNEPNGLPTGFTANATKATFDSGTDSWVGEGATSATQDTVTYNSGGGALKATKVYGSGAVVSRVNDGRGSTLHDISANGLTLSAYVFVPSANTGTGWQAHIEVQKPDFSYAIANNTNLTKGTWTNITYTMTSTVAASMRAIVVQFSANNVNATASAYVDDITQGTSQTPQKLWEGSSQAALSAIRANSDTKLIMVEGYNYAAAQTWSTNHPTAWITDSANNFRYEAHHYWDSDNSGTYVSNYATELASAISHGYTATGTQAPSGSLVINSGSTSTATTSVTLTPSASDDIDSSSWLQIKISNLSDFSDANWQTFSSSFAWSLSNGTGVKSVSAQFRDSAGNVSATSTANITYSLPTPTPTPSSVTSNTSVNTDTSQSSVCSKSAPSSAPTLLSVSGLTPTSISLSYSDAGDPYDSYFVEYGTSSGKYNLGGGKIAGKGTNTSLVSALQSGTTYYFRIRGGNDCQPGPWSNELSSLTQSLIPVNTLTFEKTDLKAVPLKKDTNTSSTPIVTPTLQIKVNNYSLNISVVDSSNHPVVGAKVVLHSTPREAITDAKGIAHFQNVEEGDHRVLISYNNYKGEESVHLSGNDVKTFDVNVKVKPASTMSSPLVPVAIVQFIVIGVLGWFVYKKRQKHIA
ncbi:hypothetical protein BH09PAT1_BH09PAT1_0960 [soil metagenome]